MAKSVDEQEARKRYVRQRQTKVFSIVAAALVVVLIVACLFYFHVIRLSDHANPQVQPNYGVTAPCASKDENGNAAAYMQNSQVRVRVLNGTKFSGLARAVGDALTNRNFHLVSVSNYQSQKVERTTVRFGRNGIVQAYSLQGNFTDAVMVMDDRQDDLVDVIIGATFSDLQGKSKVPVAGAAIKSIKGCQPVDNIKNLPKAIPE
ncbi:hypothetical protein CRD60_07755 [Bifidobacterium aemilianum]|uniref:LytR/CpsA/Psr regulator C-terminal domain-containing protein n=1 Tax=Bifidobacterium aemilianum TaxID=2493120 RepID=A0A366K7Y3_9BIFI|nr:LytR C-terminal domain-containing protein [Bifidobacterium aemilianum]RBP97268.1 hypothetical protein CRD60_07755 [Bifidobacterium aemilianum]